MILSTITEPKAEGLRMNSKQAARIFANKLFKASAMATHISSLVDVISCAGMDRSEDAARNIPGALIVVASDLEQLGEYLRDMEVQIAEDNELPNTYSQRQKEILYNIGKDE